MPDAEALSSLIAEIYDAALDPALWPGVLAKAARFLPGFSAVIYAKDAANKAGNVYYDDGGISSHYKAIYFEEYVKIDPANAAHFFSDIEVPVSTTDIMPYDEFADTRFFREWVKPQGLVDFISAPLERTATSAALFGIFRGRAHGIIDNEARRRMRLIVPHVRRAVLIGKVIDLRTLESATLADTLDGIVAGMYLVDARGQVVHANAAGHALLVADEILRAPGGRLTAADPQADQALREVFASAGSGDAAVGTRGVAIPLRGRDGQHHVAHVLPLTSGARRQAGAVYAAVAAVFVRKTRLEAPAMPEVVARLYGLTPSELRVLLAVFETGGVADLAAALGISEATAKTHLRRLFEKTGTRRQADLVRLVAGFAVPGG
ncbi:MAG: helix-turn-helix transcriptional regulator [Xanthobacteraceae bacterium]|nr:helix-turn-helix transcriptional regulator [Xanthobacteraceae bacterium]